MGQICWNIYEASSRALKAVAQLSRSKKLASTKRAINDPYYDKPRHFINPTAPKPQIEH